MGRLRSRLSSAVAARALSGRMSAQLRTQSLAAQNLANADTPGYRASRPIFAEHPALQRDTARITAQRAYEMNSRVITASDEMLSTLTRLK